MKSTYTWWGIALLGLLAFFLIFSPGCRKVRNSNPNLAEQRQHLFFFNYSIKRPVMKAGDDETGESTLMEPREFVGDKLRVRLRRGTIPSSVIREFSTITGANISVDYFDDTVEVYDRFRENDQYDVVMTSHYIVKRLAEEKILREMDLKLIPNSKGIARRFYKLSDRHEPAYGLTYLWTVTGIAYNFQYFDHRPRSWKEFFEPTQEMNKWIEDKLSVLPSPHPNFAAALLALGYSPNSEDPVELDAAERYLAQRMEHYQVIDHMELGDAFSKETLVMAQATSADVGLMDDSNVMFSVPEEGSWIQFDMIGMSAKVEDERLSQLAHAFVNFLFRPVVSAAVVESSRHASTVDRATVFIRSSIRNSVTYISGDEKKTFILSNSLSGQQKREEAVRRLHPLAQDGVKGEEPVFSIQPVPAAE